MIILITSQSHRLLNEHLAKLIKAFKTKTAEKGQVARFNVEKETKAEDIRNQLSTPSLFASKQLLIIRNAVSLLPAAEISRLLDLLKKGTVPAETTLVLVEIEPLPKATQNKLLAYLKKSTTVKKIQVAPPVAGRAIQDLNARAEELGVHFEARAAQLLWQKSGTDYDRLLYGLEKLALFALGRGDKAITVADVEETVEAQLESDIFKTIGAIGQGRLSEALTLLHRHLNQGEHPLYLLTMLRYQFKTLIQVQEAQKEANNPYEIGQITKLSPFVVRKSLGHLTSFEDRDLKQIFLKLVDADEAIKTSRIEGDIALDLITFAVAH